MKKNDLTGESAFEQVWSKAQAIPHDQVTRGGVNLDMAASIALGAVKRLEDDPTIEKRLRSFTADVFDTECIDRLPVLAAALVYARQKALTDAATTSSALVPVELIERATAIRARMLALAEYWFNDDEMLREEIADIRRDTGHLDTASDCARLAAIYLAHPNVVSKDAKNYRKTDAADALEVASQIRKLYTVQTEKPWPERANRVFTLLEADYDEVRTAVAFAFRNSPQKVALFPSLRPGGRKRRSTSGNDTTAPQTPAPTGPELAPA